MADFFIKKGDLRPALRVQFKDGAGTPIDCTGATFIVRGRMKGATSLKVNGSAATAVDAALGIYDYNWQGTDTDTEGTMYVEFRRTDGNQQTAPNNGHIEVQIGPNV